MHDIEKQLDELELKGVDLEKQLRGCEGGKENGSSFVAVGRCEAHVLLLGTFDSIPRNSHYVGDTRLPKVPGVAR